MARGRAAADRDDRRPPRAPPVARPRWLAPVLARAASRSRSGRCSSSAPGSSRTCCRARRRSATQLAAGRPAGRGRRRSPRGRTCWSGSLRRRAAPRSLAAIVAARSRMVDALMSPTAAALSVMPIVALAPALNTMFGTTSTTPAAARRRGRRVRARSSSTRCAGCARCSPCTGTCCARTPRRRGRSTRTVTIPGALPFVFTGLRIASSTGVIAGGRRGVLRRPAERARLADHVRRGQQRLRAGLGVRARGDPARPRLLPGDPRARARGGSSHRGLSARPAHVRLPATPGRPIPQQRSDGSQTKGMTMRHTRRTAWSVAASGVAGGARPVRVRQQRRRRRRPPSPRRTCRSTR